jgi:hypothetical protein
LYCRAPVSVCIIYIVYTLSHHQTSDSWVLLRTFQKICFSFYSS